MEHWRDTEGPIDCGPGLHIIAEDLKEVALGFDVEGVHTPWLWVAVDHALRWDVPQH